MKYMKDYHPISYYRKTRLNLMLLPEFSRLFGLASVSKIARWESGRDVIPDENLPKLSDVLKVDLKNLVAEIEGWNNRHPDLLEKVTIWRRVKKSMKSNGQGVEIAEPVKAPCLPPVPEGIKTEDVESYQKWLKDLEERDNKSMEQFQP